jgi:hypothetical protein
MIEITTTNINRSPRISNNPDEKTSAIASISEINRETIAPFDVLSKYFIRKEER